MGDMGPFADEKENMSHSSQMHRQVEEEPWTPSQKFRMGLVFLGLYAISPPIIIGLARLIGSPTWFMHSLGFFYSPVVYLRQEVPMINSFYEAYRVLMQPWFSGI